MWGKKNNEKIASQKITKNVTAFARTTHKSQLWINEMQKELKWLNGDSLYHLLRAVLQSLRDQMSVHEAAHFSAQLPLILRGAFYEGWNPRAERLTGVSKDDFIAAVKGRLSQAGMPRFELEDGVLTALNVIKKHISAGEMDDLVSQVEPSLKTFIRRNTSQPETAI